MLSNTLSKKMLPVAVRAHGAPIFGHAVAQLAPMLVVAGGAGTNHGGRLLSTPPAKVVNKKFHDVTPLSYLFDDFDDFFARTPFRASPGDIKSLIRQTDFMNHDWRNKKNYYPGIDVAQDETSVNVKLDVPGVKMDDIEVEVQDNEFLRVKGHRKVEKDGNVSELTFDRSFTLGEHIDKENIAAQLTDGVLTLTLPKIEVEEKVDQVRKIAISDGTVEGTVEKLEEKTVE